MLDSAHATHGGSSSLHQSDMDFTPKRMLLNSGAGSSSGPGSDGEESYGDSDQ